MTYECNEETAEAKAQAYGPNQLSLFKMYARNTHTSMTLNISITLLGFTMSCSQQGLSSVKTLASPSLIV